MGFEIDFSRYRLVDLSKKVIPNLPGDRPFEICESRLADETYKYEITHTHTHVGTHVESPWHFYHQGKTITDFPLSHFMGRARLFRATVEEESDTVLFENLQKSLDPFQGEFEILLIRNDSGCHPVHFDLHAVEYLRKFNLKLLVFEADVSFGRTVEEGRHFHDLLMSRDVCLVEFPEHCEELNRDEFYLFALPMRVEGLDSAMCRLFAVIEK